jgi:hypothetical protein
MWYMIEQEARLPRAGLVDDRPLRGTEGHDRNREDPVVLAVDVRLEGVEQVDDRHRQVGRPAIQVVDRPLEAAVLTLQRIDLVEELSGVPQCPEDAVLLTPDVSSQEGHDVGEPGQGGAEVVGAHGPADAVRLVDQGGVLVHQLTDGLDLATAAVVTHAGHPPGPSRGGAGGCPAGRRHGCGRRCRGGSGSPPAR